jgi:hypothetical protein
LHDYIQQFHHADHRIFPFRYFTDANDNVLPFVAVTAFFRDEKAKARYHEYKRRREFIYLGIIAYKSSRKKSY